VLPIVAFIFLTFFCVFVAIYLDFVWRQGSPQSELRRRLRYLANTGARGMPVKPRSEIMREVAPVDRYLLRLNFMRILEKKLDHAGFQLKVSSFALIYLTLAVACAAFAVFLTKSVLSGVLAVAASAVLTSVYIKLKTQRRCAKFTELFPDALSMISRSLRAGHSLNTAIQLIGQEVSNPVGELFKMAYDQQQLGLRITDSLTNMNERIESLDLRFFTTVIGINSEVGGNLTEVLDKLSVTIRERLRIRRQVRVYTAQGRMSGYVLGALPIIAFLAITILNPQYEVALIRDPMGLYVLILAVCMQLAGALIITNIIKIKI